MNGNSTIHRVSAATISGGLVAIIVWAVGQWLGVTIPGEAAAGMTTVLTPILSWAIPDHWEA